MTYDYLILNIRKHFFPHLREERLIFCIGGTYTVKMSIEIIIAIMRWPYKP